MALTVRQLWALDFVGDNPGATVREVAIRSPVDEPRTATLASRHGSTVEVRTLSYRDAYTALARLRKLGLIRRGAGGTLGPFRHYIEPAGRERLDVDRQLEGLAA